jgi:uncharacterized metal-binding protein
MKKKVMVPRLGWFFIGALCIVATVIILLELSYDKTGVSVTGIIQRYLSALILGLAFERYLRILPKPHNSSKPGCKLTILSWFKFAVLHGALHWGFGMATFALLAYRFICGLSFSNMAVPLLDIIIYVYILCFIAGFCFGNIMYIVALIGIKYMTRKNKQEIRK